MSLAATPSEKVICCVAASAMTIFLHCSWVWSSSAGSGNCAGVANEGVKPTVGDLLTKVCASALMRHRAVNALYRGDSIELHPTANVGIAVAVPKGLVVPVIRDVDKKTLGELAKELEETSERARARRLTPSDMQGASITISW